MGVFFLGPETVTVALSFCRVYVSDLQQVAVHGLEDTMQLIHAGLARQPVHRTTSLLLET
jgi:hypothetical protein